MDPFVAEMIEEDSIFDPFDEETRREVNDYYDDLSEGISFDSAHDF